MWTNENYKRFETMAKEREEELDAANSVASSGCGESKVTLADWLRDAMKEAADVPQQMCLFVDEQSDSVSLILDNQRNYYGEWIKGEGGDICLYRDMETDKVVGCHLPLYVKRLSVSRFSRDDSA